MVRGAYSGALILALLLVGPDVANAAGSHHRHHRRAHKESAQPAQAVSGKPAVQATPAAVGTAPVRAAEVEPPPTETEPPPLEVEPPPEALREDPIEPKPDPKLQAEKQALARRQRIFSGLGFASAALTAGLLVTGPTLGVLAQNRSDELSRLTVQSENGIAPMYDADQRSTYERLQQEGLLFRSATIGFFVAGGVAAIGTGLLFYGQSRTESAQKKLSLFSVVTGNTTGLALLGRF